MFTNARGAGDRESAARQAVRAARKASDALAFDRAALFYCRALELGPGDEAQRSQLLRALAESLTNAGRSSEAAAYLDLARRSGAENGLQCRGLAARILLAGGHFDEGIGELRTVLRAMGLGMASSPTGALVSLLLRRLRLRLRGFGFQVRDPEEVPEETLERIDACWTAAGHLATAAPVPAADFQTRHLLLALDAGEPRRLARALGVEAAFVAFAGGAARPRAKRLLDLAGDLTRGLDDPHATGVGHLTAGLVAYFLGEWGEAAERLDEAESVFTTRCVGALWEVTTARRYALSARVFRGELAEISRRLPAYLAEAGERGNLPATTDLRTRLGILWLAADDTEGL